MCVAHRKQEETQPGSVQRRQRDLFPHSGRAAHLLADVSRQMEFRRKNNLCSAPLTPLQPLIWFGRVHSSAPTELFLDFRPQIGGGGQPREPQPSLALTLIKGQRRSTHLGAGRPPRQKPKG